MNAACFVVQSCLADADFVVFSNYCLISTRQNRPLFSLCLRLALDRLRFAEEHRDAPHAGKPHERVDHAADRAHLPAAEKGNDVKAEDTDAAPVERADDGERQGDLVHEHGIPSLIVFDWPSIVSANGKKLCTLKNFSKSGEKIGENLPLWIAFCGGDIV